MLRKSNRQKHRNHVIARENNIFLSSNYSGVSRIREQRATIRGTLYTSIEESRDKKKTVLYYGRDVLMLIIDAAVRT